MPERGKTGLPMGPETQLRMPLADFEALCARLAPRNLVDATGCLQRVREVKSEAEVAKIREACAIAARAFDRVPTFAQPGRSLAEVFRDFQIALLAEGATGSAMLPAARGRMATAMSSRRPGRSACAGAMS